MNNIQLSIIILSHNFDNNIEECLKNIINNNLNIEIILICNFLIKKLDSYSIEVIQCLAVTNYLKPFIFLNISALEASLRNSFVKIFKRYVC